jgi:serine/threonine protein kinase
MNPNRRPGRDEPGDDALAGARCAVLDDYWAELQRHPESDSRSWLSGRSIPVQTLVADLDTLKLLHHFRGPGTASDEASQAPTVVVSEPFGSGAPARAPDLAPREGRGAEGDRAAGPDLALAPGGQEPAATADRPPAPASAASPAAEGQGPQADAAPMERIGKYLVLELLDSGGQARVFRVFHPGLGKEFVLKLARRLLEAGSSPFAAGPPHRAGLIREGRILARCDHPNLVQVVDLDVHEGRPFVVMEHVSGLTLQQFAGQHPVAPRQAARLVAELARAVAYLHARRIVHQDIKPRNVLVDDRGRPRLIDFGLARLRHAWSDDEDDWVGGTADYMSPEQAQGRPDLVGTWTDVFGLGALLYHLLTGGPLYRGASRVSVVRQAREAGYVPVRQVNPRVPRALERICHQAMAAEPAQRYRTAAELERALRWFRARRWITATGLVVLALTALAMFAPRPATTTPGLEPPSIATPATPLRIDSFEVVHRRLKPRGEDGKAEGYETIGKLDKIPCQIRECDEVDVSAQLAAPAYSYLIALNPDGKDQLCHPSDQSKVPPQSTKIPFDDFFRLTDGPGLQAFVVVASRRPLPPYEQWPARDGLRQRWRHVAADDVDDGWEYKDGQVKRLSSGARGMLVKRPGAESLALFRGICDYLQKLPDIEVVQAIAFPVRPKG